ncbi:MAG: mechanosensitive ion channel family protein [Candidatus Cyclobacteriaceae bacterium M3_2C_046]
MQDFQNYLDTAVEYAMLYLPRVVLAILFLIVGIWLIKSIGKRFKSTMKKKDLDPSLVPFLSGIFKFVLYTLLIISVASMVGIATTSFVAVLGAAGLAIGLALQGSLSNFAGGVMILIMRPFKVGEVIEAQGVIALVTEIMIFHTKLKTYDNKIIILPNGPLYNDKIINYSEEPTRLVEWHFGIGYQDDIDKARDIIQKEVFESDDRILNAANPYINISELGDSAVIFRVRAEVNQADYWNVFFHKNEAVKKAFDAAGVSIPFPQRDVHLYSNTSGNGVSSELKNVGS